MSRNNKNKANAKEIELVGDTLCEQFDNYFRDHKKISDIIEFLHVVNASLLPQFDHLTEEQKNDIVEFVDYFDDEFLPICYNAIDDEWGELPLIFDLADSIKYDRQLSGYQEEYEKMSTFRRKEADTLAKTLFDIRENREVYFETAEDSDTFVFQKSIPAKSLKTAEEVMHKICGHVVAKNGIMQVTMKKPGVDEIFGIIVQQNGFWTPIEKNQMRKMMLTTASGMELEPEDGVKYVQIQRELF